MTEQRSLAKNKARIANKQSKPRQTDMESRMGVTRGGGSRRGVKDTVTEGN